MPRGFDPRQTRSRYRQSGPEPCVPWAGYRAGGRNQSEPGPRDVGAWVKANGEPVPGSPEGMHSYPEPRSVPSSESLRRPGMEAESLTSVDSA